MAPRLKIALFALMPLLLAAAPGCRAKIGAACKVSTDCSIVGGRTCDLSYVIDKSGFVDPDGKGECIIEGCTPTSCPREAVCVQVYSTQYLSVACDPEREDREEVGGVLVDDCDPNEICLPEGICADFNTARATCRRECKRDSTCRDGYECRDTGGNGIYVARDPTMPSVSTETSICMPLDH